MSTEILIVGGGLSGLHTAFELERRGLDYLLVEGRDRLGGRILSSNLDSTAYDPEQCAFDLGPAWFWPGQRRMESLVRELGLSSQVFAQYGEGVSLLEAAPGAIKRGDFGGSMAGSYRLRGGMRQIIHHLARAIPAEKIRLGTRATRLEKRDHRIQLTVTHGESLGEELSGRFVVLALPPRVAMATIEWCPDLPDRRQSELRSLATWMASSGKMMALYSEPFWRNEGLSGDAFSHLGPLSEIHDASPFSGTPYALFGFFGVPATSRRDQEEALRRACLAQLQRLFGPKAAEPLEVFLKDWAFDPMTATAEDLRGPAEHSLVGLGQTVEDSWDRQLIWSGSETASPNQRSNGYLEGALESSRRTLELLASAMKNAGPD